jgi:hypothetical protein
MLDRDGTIGPRQNTNSTQKTRERPNYPSKRTGWPVASATGLCQQRTLALDPRHPAVAVTRRRDRSALILDDTNNSAEPLARVSIFGVADLKQEATRPPI